MPRTNEYKTSKSFPESLRGNTVTWDVPVTVAEATDASIGPDGKPFFADEATLVRYAVAQLNIRKAHKAAAAATDLAGAKENARVMTLDEVTAIMRNTVAEPVRERVAGGAPKPTSEVRQKAARADKIDNAITESLPKLNKSQLAGFVVAGLITQDQMDAELARRA